MFSRKCRTIFFAVVLGLFLSPISISTTLASTSFLKTDISLPSSLVWSDDFENTTETLNNWEFTGYNLTDFGEPYTPDVTLSDGLLYSDGPGISCLNHDSTIAVGTWSFDLFLGESSYYFMMVVFMSPYWDGYWVPEGGYAFMIDSWDSNRFGLVKIDESTGAPTLIDEEPFEEILGWMHIDITRQSDNRMYVFLNGTLILGGSNTEFSSSEYFRLYSEYYFVADNITVTDTVDFDGVKPQWTEPLVNHVVHEGNDFNHTLYATDYSGLDSWWVNDTENFVITQEGNIASIDPLPIGIYGVEVFVNDTFGNVRNGSFNVEVIEWPPPTPTTTSDTTTSTTTTSTATTSRTNTTATTSPLILILTGFVGGASASIIVLIILVRRKT